ncbi:MAG: tRNA (N(6)-L-threonylcarbamoyladenosine(37)-C(2))-methylthiotransferase MtaB [Pontiellaceae bacterium]|nr:tRNA (N(6)-L-threonylcarbamoyladenosine(37)-C(2))-methylthiotransferase MtaB [Pontiellaceae bacterium]MBN2786069.1 tRNA (N(6)-L-threonylcarbamoyladenosine(37)-C(2))-methylthiotransferase MtaB [Pontiellaceae bacterium]
MNNNPPTTYSVAVLGCKVNQYDAQQIEQLLEQHGLAKAPENECPDIIIIHTCGVTAAAAQKSRQIIRRMQRDNPVARIIVTGCAAGDELTRIDQDPVFRVPAGSDWLKRLAEQLASISTPNAISADGIETDTYTISSFGDQTRAFLKVQDGCDIGCSYCIIPQLRKEPRDKAVDAAVREARALTKAGHREIVVTGVSVGLYGREHGSSLAKLLRHIAEVPDIGRIRLSSLHPGELTDELLEVWASRPNIMPHLHLSLQSGSDAVLHAMRRGYTTSEYFDAIERARAALKNPAFTTDIIVGFPGETDTYFEESYAFCKKVGFSRMHIFTYSPRPKTIAAKMGRQINGAVATERSDRLHELEATMARNYHERFLGQTVEVLVEKPRNGIGNGYTAQYVPVEFPEEMGARGTILQLKPTAANEQGLTCSR